MNLKRLGGCKPKSADERFEESYIAEPNSGCYLWLGRERGSNGYGGITVNGKQVVAHRYAWERANGPIPDGYCVMHKCDTPACVNVAHLDAVPPIENELDKVRKGRQARGERLSLAQGNATLTKEQAMEIFQSNDLQKTLVAKYGISQGAISAIKTKRTWRHMHGL